MSKAEDLELRLLLEAIYLRYHFDFRGYAMASVRRRLRAACEALGYPSLSSLQERLLRDPSVFSELLQYLTVQVSDLFRDPAFYQTLRETIVPVLATYPSLKVWVAGCASGEELYSMAILLREEGLLDRTILYATDINPEALRRAEAGVYPLDRLPAFTENHFAAGGKGSLAQHYTAGYGSAVFDRGLRKNVVFSDHSLATDSVFAEVQLVTCRNVLIYFDRTLQNRAVTLLRDALCRRGYLGLGTRESLQVTSVAEQFEELVPGQRWYRKC